MSMPLHLLLKLPPALRCHAATHFLHQPNRSTRLFSKTTQTLQSKPPKPTLRRAQQQQPQATSQGLPPPPKQAPKPRAAAGARPTSGDGILRQFYASNDSHLLLYKAPSHGSFYFNSYLLGSGLIIAAIVQSWNVSKPPEALREKAEAERLRPSRLAQGTTFFTSIIMAIFGTTFFLAPSKLIRSVSVVKPAGAPGPANQARLLFEMKHPFPIIQRLPFMRKSGGGSITTELNSAFMDRNVRANERLVMYTIPSTSAQSWTADYLNPPPRPRRSILDHLKGFNNSLLNAWPTFRTDVGRMFMREGMAYIRIQDHGNWKMDLHGSELLEAGKVLERVVSVDPGEVDRSWLTRIREMFGGGARA